LFSQGRVLARRRPRLLEIDENLKRQDLTVLEQGEHLQRREELLIAKGLRAASGTSIANAASGDKLSPVPKTTATIAAEVGLTERSAQRRVKIAKDLPQSTRDIVRNADVS
jgi:hypothetical protein